MNRDWSRMISIVMSGGSVGLIVAEPGLARRRTTLTVLVPDCFCTTRLTALSPSSRVRPRGSSIESSARPMSLMRIGIAVAVGDDQVVELGGRREPAQRAQHQLARALVHDAAGHLQVLRHQGLAHVLDRQAVGRPAGRCRRTTLIARVRPPDRNTRADAGHRLRAVP